MHALAMIFALSTIGANDFTVTTLGSGAAANAATTTSSDVTLAVSSTGNDTGGQPAVITGGDYSSVPFATIQAALDALPDLVCHDVEIDVGTGASFAGALISKQGCASSPESYAWIKIYGTREAATLASGSVSGTATSGGTSTLTLTGANWTVDDLQGRILYVTAGTGAGEYVIATNTTDTITTPTVVTFDATSVFQLEDLATEVSAPRGGGYAGDYVFEINRNETNVYLRDLRITYADAAANGVFVNYATAIAERVVVDTSNAYDGFKVVSGGTLTVISCGVLDTPGNAAYSSYGDTAVLYYLGIMADVTGVGIRAVYGGDISNSSSGGIWIEATTDGIRIDDCNKTARVSLLSVHVGNAQNGIYSDNCTATLDTIDIDDTTSKTVYAHESELIIDTALTGTGNVWGMDLSQPGNIVYFSATPTITGSSGDTTFDGTAATSWSSTIAESPGLLFTGFSKFDTMAVGATADPSDFYNPILLVSNGDTGWTYSALHPAIVGEGKSTAAKVGVGGLFVGQTSSAHTAYGFQAAGKVSDPSDTSEAVGFYAYAYDVHNGPNIAAYLYAVQGTENYALVVYGGDVKTFGAADWDVKDNDPSPLSIDAADAAGILEIVSTDSHEQAKSAFGFRPGKYTADPCGGLEEGSLFYNDTSDYFCFCDGAGDDKQFHAPATDCF